MKQWLDTSKMTDGELADLIHELSDELGSRLSLSKYRGLKGVMEAASLRVRSWSSAAQRAMRSF